MKARLANSVVLDLGSNKIVALASCIENNGDARIVAQHLSYSEGINSGMITDLKKSENSIINAIYSLEKSCDKNVKNVSISLSGFGTKSYYIYHKIDIAGKSPITKKDVQKLIQKSLAEFRRDNQDVIHYFPIEFTLDDSASLSDPIGMIGRELGCRLHVVTANSSLLLNLSNCLSKCQIDISNIFLAIYADGIACLTEDEQNLGSLIIDIGLKTTSFGVFIGKKLIYSGHIPVGGWHITSDIAKAFYINEAAAEKIKILYGSASNIGLGKDSVIDLEDFDPNSLDDLGSGSITMKDLSAIITPRVEEILELVKQEYDKIAVDHLISRRVVLTGGSAMMHGIKEMAAKIFSRQVRIGKPASIPGFAEDCNPCVYSTSIGMVKLNAIAKQKQFYLMSQYNDDIGFFSKVVKWLKDNI